MVQASFGTSPLPSTPVLGDGGSAYQPGVCNIGPAEIARRRRAGHVGLGATVILGGGLLAVGAPPLARLLVALPAALAASGYLPGPPALLCRLRLSGRLQLRIPRRDPPGDGRRRPRARPCEGDADRPGQPGQRAPRGRPGRAPPAVTTLERDPVSDDAGAADPLVLRFLLVPSLVVLLDRWN